MILEHVNFSVQKGDFALIIGDNGVGKSTMVKLLLGVNSPTSGEILISGKKVRSLKDSRIGYLPQNGGSRAAAFPATCEEIVMSSLYKEIGFGRFAGKKQKEKVQKALALVDMEEKRKALIGELSGGQQQRVMLARVLAGDPEVLILDEPTVGLDPMQITWMRELIRSLGREHTIILSSHILFEVNAVCDRVLIINHGKKVIIDTPENIIRTLGGTNGVRIVVRAGGDAVKNALSGIGNISRIETLTEDVGENLTAYAVYSSDGSEIRDRIASACAKKGISLFELNAIQKTLEDVFIEMTGKEGDTK